MYKTACKNYYRRTQIHAILEDESKKGPPKPHRDLSKEEILLQEHLDRYKKQRMKKGGKKFYDVKSLGKLKRDLFTMIGKLDNKIQALGVKSSVAKTKVKKRISYYYALSKDIEKNIANLHQQEAIKRIYVKNINMQIIENYSKAYPDINEMKNADLVKMRNACSAYIACLKEEGSGKLTEKKSMAEAAALARLEKEIGLLLNINQKSKCSVMQVKDGRCSISLSKYNITDMKRKQ